MPIALGDAQANFYNGGAQAQIGNDLSGIAPYVSTVATAAPQEQQVMAQPKAGQGGALSQFGHWLGGIAMQTGHVAEGAAQWLVTNTAHLAEAPYKVGEGIAQGLGDNSSINALNIQNQQVSERLQAAANQYKSGAITKDNYQQTLKSLSQDNKNISTQQNALSSRINIDQKNTVQSGIDTATALVTVLTAGFGAATTTAITRAGLQPLEAKTAAEWLGSKAANVYLNQVEGKLSYLATNVRGFEELGTAARVALQKANAEVIAGNAGTMTAQQIARATAANVALKYPIYYGTYFNPVGHQIYTELDQQKYGAAVRTLAFNAALVLSGGPIGWALKQGGRAASAIVPRIFERSSFIDQLSRSIGTGEADGMVQAVNKLPEADRAEAVQNLSALESTNMAAVGHDPIAAANRVIDGMSSYEGVSMRNFTHDEALNNMLNFAKAQRLADETAKANGMTGITVGRLDQRTLAGISARLSPLVGDEGQTAKALQEWENMKTEQPNSAWANNANLDRQIQSLIQKHDNPADFNASVSSIKAQFAVKGFPKSVGEQLAKMGYIPIKPVKLEAPFTEGSGKLATKYGGANAPDYFTHTVQPVPILGHLGQAFTSLGLSPYSTSHQVYQMYNAALTNNLVDSGVMKSLKLLGEGDKNETGTADLVIKRLSNYMHDPTRGGISVGTGRVRLPLTDLRQLSTKDIQVALDIPKADAQKIGDAIMQSMIQLPLSIRGLGDRLSDVTQNIPGFRKYLQVQGGARFAWNPFFKAKVSAKIELLSQAEAGGKFPTLPGMNWLLQSVFPETYHAIDGTTEVLKSINAFGKSEGHMLNDVGEGVDAAGMGPNLNHTLTKAQERSISSLINTQAAKAGMNVTDFVHNNPQNVRDTVQMIAQYDRNANFINSPMARTLNFAFFPFRFETKVATIMAKSLAKTTLPTQLAVIGGLYKARDWLNSQEGQAWYSQNSDAIKVLEYFTPLQTMAEVAGLLGGNKDAISSFGELGGLPFGFIPQLLDAEGLTNFGSSYIDPKTGQQIPKTVPVNTQGRALAAIQSFVGSLFSYPGKTLGMPSKTTIMHKATSGLFGSTKADFQSVSGPLTPAQQQYQKNVQTPQPGQSAPAIKATTTPVATTVPTTGSGTAAPKYKNGTPKVKKKTKSEFTPALLPGQTTRGQV